MKKRCLLKKAGIVDYTGGLALQAEARELVSQDKWDGCLILLEHPPVITIGRGGGIENLCLSKEYLEAKGIEVAMTDRGGNITCHNPGQLVGYPVLNLRKWKQDVHWYVDMVEEVIIKTLARLGLRAGRKPRYTGVWLGNEKISAIGVAVKQWITGHGFAFNVNNDLSLFQAIVPCGITEFGVTNLKKAGIDISLAEVTSIVTEEFCTIFECSLEDDTAIHC